MQSGLETTSNRNYGKWVLSDNWIEFALNQPLVAAPGTRMLYSTGSTHLLSAIVTQASGMSTKQFAQENLSSRLGFSMSYWSQDPQGIYFGGNDMEMTPRQMLEFGRLYLNEGIKGNEQVISKAWVEESHKPRAMIAARTGPFLRLRLVAERSRRHADPCCLGLWWAAHLRGQGIRLGRRGYIGKYARPG